MRYTGGQRPAAIADQREGVPTESDDAGNISKTGGAAKGGKTGRVRERREPVRQREGDSTNACACGVRRFV